MKNLVELENTTDKGYKFTQDDHKSGKLTWSFLV